MSPPQAMANRHVMILILAAAVAAGLGLWLGRGMNANTTTSAQPRQMRATLLYPTPRAIADFSITRADNTPLTAADLRGQWNLVFFGFTHCPDVCPTTLAVMRQVEEQLAAVEHPPAVRMIFISIDPERDQGKPLADYVAYFSSRIIAATGSIDALTTMARGMGVVFMKSPLPSGDYTMDHSAHLVLIDPQARMTGIMRPPHDARAIVADLTELAEQAR